MRSNLITALAAAALAASALPALSIEASAMPGAQPLPLAGAAPDITLASGGCGPYRHRGGNGFCYPNGGGFYRGGYGYGRPYGYGGGYGYGRPYGYGGGFFR